MGIIKDRRPRDWSYLAEFNQEDLPALQAMVKHVRETHDVEMIELFNCNCERVLYGLDADVGTPIPTQVTKTDDLTTNVGLQECIKIILGTTSTRFRYIGLGTGTAAPTVSNTGLGTEFATSSIRIDTLSLGWNEAVGMKLFYGGIFPESFIETGFTEFGVFNAAGVNSGVILNRNVFNQVARNLFAAVFIISSVIEFCPVA